MMRFFSACVGRSQSSSKKSTPADTLQQYSNPLYSPLVKSVPVWKVASIGNPPVLPSDPGAAKTAECITLGSWSDGSLHGDSLNDDASLRTQP